ncbi:MAG: hypothetical protein KAJ17_03220 [Candidatus Krumholzibacteria bacterium]|nr:hypothetical protein [Candidatus Krumholzibacteria bacterium]
MTPKNHTRPWLEDIRRDIGTLIADPANRRVLIVLFSSCLLLLVFGIWGRPGYYTSHIYQGAMSALGIGPNAPYAHLVPYYYWAISALLIRIVVPCVIIRWALKERVGNFGYRLPGAAGHAWVYVGLFLLMIPIVYIASHTEGFQNKYPMDKLAAQGWDHLLLYEIAYGIQFFGVESFFRGFMTFGLFARFGYYGLFIMVIPYAMVHFGKPPAEVFAAVPAGLLLGYLALKTRSWLYGALLHWGVGISMDIAALIQKGWSQG